MGYGIPTNFDWRRYRSRLEARWASFFDLLGWQFEYEPFDLAGWIPDFGLFGAGGKLAALVEVKPHAVQEEFLLSRAYENEIERAWPLDARTERSMLESARRRPRLLLSGVRIFEGENGFPVIGWVTDSPLHGNPPDEAVVIGPPFDFVHSTGLYEHVLAGKHDGGHYYPADFEDVHRLWNEAANRVQWKGEAA